MADTVFVDGTTVVVAEWLNDVNQSVYDAIGNGTVAPNTPTEVRANINVPTRTGGEASGTWNIDISGNADTATALAGTLGIAEGGTGQTTASAAFNALKQIGTETSSGVFEISTTAESQAATSDVVVITPLKMKAAQIQLVSPTTLTTQTTVDFLAIPSWAKRITLMLNGVSTNGTSPLLIQIGDSGGIETSGYAGAASSILASTAAATNFTTGFGITNTTAAAGVYQGAITISLMVGSIWVASGISARSDGGVVCMTAGIKGLSAALDRVRLTTLNGTDQFDAGSVNISYE